nr:hypothetical protein CFP56_75500 [Quercus suber]
MTTARPRAMRRAVGMKTEILSRQGEVRRRRLQGQRETQDGQRGVSVGSSNCAGGGPVAPDSTVVLSGYFRRTYPVSTDRPAGPASCDDAPRQQTADGRQ